MRIGTPVGQPIPTRAGSSTIQNPFDLSRLDQLQTGTGANTYYQLRQRLDCIRELLASQDTFTAFMRSAFDAKGLEASCQILRHGMTRLHDDHIADQICRILASRDPNQPLRILGLGCGRTFGLRDQYGAPWDMRALALAFPNRVEVTLTDYIPEDNVRYFLVDSQGILRTGTLNIFLQTEQLPNSYSQILRGKDDIMRIAPSTLASRMQAYIPNAPNNTQLERELRIFTRAAPEEWPSLRLMPQVDPRIEHLFGIKDFLLKVDYFNPSIELGERQFDVILGRHLNASLREDQLDQIMSAVHPHAAPGAYIFIHADQHRPREAHLVG